MRHFGSLLVAAVFAPSIFLLTGTGLSAFNSALDDNKVFDPLSSLAALGALLLAGILYGILVLARLSPLGPGLAGFAVWGVSGWALFDIEGYRDYFSQLDVHMGGSVGEMGLGILLGVPLLATLFSGRRWRRSELQPPPPIIGVARQPSDAPWLLPAAPVYQSSPLPDIPPPSLRYPAAAAFPAPPISAPPVSAPPASGPPWPPASPPPVSAPPYSPPPASRPTSAPPASAPPSSGPPVSAPPASGPPASAPSGSPGQVFMVPPGEAPPLPRRVPSRPPADDEVTEPVISSPPPDNEATERLTAPGSIAPQAKPATADNEDETVHLRPE